MALSQEFVLPPGPEPRAESGRDRASVFLGCLLAGATLLLVCQLLIGTSAYFAITVFLTLTMVIFTWRLVGFGSIVGLLIAIMALNFLVVSQVAKTIFDQPGDSNLAAPETTIGVLFVGFAAICAAAIFARQIVGKRQIISINPSPEVLLHLRNVSLLIGLVFLAVNRYSDVSLSTEAQYGGLSAITHQFSAIIFLPILAETWRILMVSRGRRSLSWFNILLIAGLTVQGFLANSKEGVIDPFILYLIGAIAYRRYVTRAQIVTSIAGLFVFIVFAYPAVQLLRSERTAAGVSVEAAGEFIYDAITDPSAVMAEWRQAQYVPPDDLYTAGISYLGTPDALMQRFALVGITDVIVNAVNVDGPYGMGLVTVGFEQMVPTILYPDKPRDDTGDLLTWHYGLRTWNVTGSPTIGIFADSYAALEWAGVIVFPFVIVFFFFIEMQLGGARLAGNFLGSFFFFGFFHAFTEGSISTLNNLILRNIPIYYAIVLGCVVAADLYIRRRVQRGNHPA